MKKQCVRCWRHIPDEYSRLWCDTCRERVNEELSWEANRPFQYYFRFNLKKIKDDKNQMQELLKRDWKKMS